MKALSAMKTHVKESVSKKNVKVSFDKKTAADDKEISTTEDDEDVEDIGSEENNSLVDDYEFGVERDNAVVSDINGVAIDGDSVDAVAGDENVGVTDSDLTTIDDEVTTDNETVVTDDKGTDDIDSVTIDDEVEDVDDDVTHDEVRTVVDMVPNVDRPKTKMFIEYILKDGSSEKATVLSRQPKRNGKWGGWLNILIDGSEIPSSLNWEDVVHWKELIEPEKEVFLTAVEEMSQEIVDAKAIEFQNLTSNDVFEPVDDIGQSRVSCKWVITTKEKDGQKIVKARLVARGFEENILNVRTDSPTCSRQSLRFCFVTAAIMRWELHSLDITSAFLQGNTIERDVHLQPPPEYQEKGMLWKLKRCIYGLKDAPRAWYDSIEK